MTCSTKVNDWKVHVKFQESGALLATANGVLLSAPQDAVSFVTDAAGDALFRVVERKELAPGPSGARRVEVVNQAAIRVLAWKLWSRSSVVHEIGRPENGSQQQWVQFELVASNMLQSLTGRWSLQPIRIHLSALPRDTLSKLTAMSTPPTPTAPSTPAAAAHRSSRKASLLQGTEPSLPFGCIPVGTNSQPAAPRDASKGLSDPALPGRGLWIRTKPTQTTSNASSGSPGSSPTKAAFWEKLAMLSPSSRRAAAAAAAAAVAAAEPQTPRPVVEITARTSSGAFNSSSSSGGLGSKGKAAWTNTPKAQALPPGLVVDAEGYVLATHVHYEQLAQPRGMPAGIRYVPGLSDAVAASVGREVRQMLDKVSCVADEAVAYSLSPQEALRSVAGAVEAAGGSFKSLQRSLRRQQQRQAKLQRQQERRRESSEAPTSPFAWAFHKAAPAGVTPSGPSPAAFGLGPSWGQEEAGAKSSGGSSAGGGKLSAIWRKSSGAGRGASAAEGGKQGLMRLLAGEGPAAGLMAASLNPVLMPFGGFGLDGCGAPAARELMSHPVMLAECSWADFDE